MSLVEKESYEYYKSALETGEHVAYLVYDNGAFVGAGGVKNDQITARLSQDQEHLTGCHIGHRRPVIGA